MKKKLILLCLGGFLLCGCEMKEEIEVSINDDKSMDIEVIMGFDDELIDTMMSMAENEEEIPTTDNTKEDEILEDDTTEEDEEIKEYTDEERQQYLRENMNFEGTDTTELESKGFTVEEFQDEKYTGYKLTGKIDNIDNLIGSPDFNLDEITQINDKKIFVKEGSVYKGKIEVGDPTDMEGETDSTNSVNLIYNFTLNLPNKVKTSNATTVSEDGKTLTWNLSSGNISTIEFEFEFPSIFTFLKDNMLLTAGIVVVVVLLIVGTITIILKKSNKKNIEELNELTRNTTSINPNNTTSLGQEQNIESTLNINQPMIQEENVTNQLNVQTINEEINNTVSQPESDPIKQYNEQIMQPEINEAQTVQQLAQNSSQEEIVNAINSIPVIKETQQATQEVQKENAIPQQGINIMQKESTTNNIVQPELQFVPNVEPQENIINSESMEQQQITDNQIPTITPIVPTTLNTAPLPLENNNKVIETQIENLVQPEMKFFTSEQQNTQVTSPEMNFATNEQMQNNVVQQNNNINNQGI